MERRTSARGRLGLTIRRVRRCPGSGPARTRVGLRAGRRAVASTAGYYLTDMLDPLADDPQIDADLREFTSRNVFASGP